jgi:hypothetical protein
MYFLYKDEVHIEYWTGSSASTISVPVMYDWKSWIIAPWEDAAICCAIWFLTKPTYFPEVFYSKHPPEQNQRETSDQYYAVLRDTTLLSSRQS